MATPTDSRTRLRKQRAWLPLAVLLLVAIVSSGCMDGANDQGDDAGEGPAAQEQEPVDSALRFHGQRRAIARVIEEYEAAVGAGDAGTLCRRLLRLGRKRVQRPQIARCIRDPDNDALARSSDSGNAVDLVVRRIVLLPHRPRAVAGIPVQVPRYQIEWDLEYYRGPIALVESAGTSRGVAEAFSLDRRAGEWRIVQRWRARAVEAPKGRRARVAFFHRHGVLGFYGVGRAGRPRCRTGEAGMITHWIVPPRGRSRNVRDAVMRSNIGPQLRRALRDGASLRVTSVDYAGPGRVFTLSSPSGRAVLSFSASGPGPSYTMDGISGCRGWLERMTQLDLSDGRAGNA